MYLSKFQTQNLDFVLISISAVYMYNVTYDFTLKPSYY